MQAAEFKCLDCYFFSETSTSPPEQASPKVTHDIPTEYTDFCSSALWKSLNNEEATAFFKLPDCTNSAATPDERVPGVYIRCNNCYTFYKARPRMRGVGATKIIDGWICDGYMNHVCIEATDAHVCIEASDAGGSDGEKESPPKIAKTSEGFMKSDSRVKAFKEEVSAAAAEYTRLKDIALSTAEREDDDFIHLMQCFRPFGIHYRVVNEGADVEIICLSCTGVKINKGKVGFCVNRRTCKAPLDRVIISHLQASAHIESRGIKSGRTTIQPPITLHFASQRYTEEQCFSADTTLADFRESDRNRARLCFGYYPTQKSDEATAARYVHEQCHALKTVDVARGTVVLVKMKGDQSFTVKYGFRSKSCATITNSPTHPFVAGTCFSCMKLPFNSELKAQIQKAMKTNVPERRFADCFRDELIEKARKLKSSLLSTRLQQFNALKKIDSLQRKLLSIEDLAKVAAPIEKMVDNIKRAWKDGKLKKDSMIFANLEDTARNLCVSNNHGLRHNKCLVRLMATWKLKGGRRNAVLFKNVHNISETTVNDLIRKERVTLSPGLLLCNFETVAKIYAEMLARMRLDTKNNPIISSIAQDESPIIKTATVIKNSAGQFEIVGFCGFKKESKEANHICFGSDSDCSTIVRALEDIEIVFDKCSLCVAVSAILICPLHPDIPCLPVAILPTCLKFTKADMSAQLNTIWEMYSLSIGKVFNYRLPIGMGSDGCSTRVPLQLNAMKLVTVRRPVGGRGRGVRANLKNADRFYFDHVVIGLGGVKQLVPKDDGVSCTEEPGHACLTCCDSVITGIHSQDSHHCVKKAIACLTNRELYLGDNLVTINVNYRVVAGEKETVDTAVSRADIERKDRMCVAAALNNCNIAAQTRIEKELQDCPHLSHSALKPSLLVMRCIHRFHLMNNSCGIGKKAVGLPLLTRIRYCSSTIALLFGWYHWVATESKKKGSQLSLRHNFLTMQCFRDMIIACNAWLLSFLVARDRTKSPRYLSVRLGSDACEKLFSQLGGFGSIEAGKRDANLEEMYRLTNNILTILKWTGDPEEGNIEQFKRTANHDLDRDHLLHDENIMLQNRLQWGVIGGVSDKLQDISDDMIKTALDEGVEEMKQALIDNDAATPALDDPNKWFDYTIINYKKDELDGGEGDEEMKREEAPDDDEEMKQEEAPDDDDDAPDDDDGAPDTINEDLQDILLQEQRELLPDRPPPEHHETDDNDNDFPPEGDDPDDLTEQQLAEDAVLDDIDGAVALGDLDDVLEDILNDGDYHGPVLEDEKKGSRKRYSENWRIVDKHGNYHDCRKVVALYSRIYKFRGATWSKDRKAKIINQRINGDLSHDAVDQPLLDEGKFRTGQFVAFHFFTKDATGKQVKPPSPIVYIGLVEKIIKRKSKGGAATIIREFLSIGKIPSEEIKCIVSWLKPILPPGETNKLKAAKYIWMPRTERKLHRGEFSAKIAFYVPDMHPNADGSYNINPDHAEAMETRYEGYNFARATTPQAPTTIANITADDHGDMDDDVDDEDL